MQSVNESRAHLGKFSSNSTNLKSYRSMISELVDTSLCIIAASVDHNRVLQRYNKVNVTTRLLHFQCLGPFLYYSKLFNECSNTLAVLMAGGGIFSSLIQIS